MKIEALKRKFIYRGNELPDIDNVTPKEVLKYYSGIYPELTNAVVNYKGIINNIETYEIQESAGVKG